MRRTTRALLALLLSALMPAFAQQTVQPQSPLLPRYQANFTTSGASKVTIQATTTSSAVLFEEADIYSATPCVVTVYINGTPATTTTLSVTGPTGVSSATPPAAFSASNVGAGTTLKSYQLAAGSTLVLDLSQFYFPAGAGGNVNLSIGTTATSTVQIQWIESPQ